MGRLRGRAAQEHQQQQEAGKGAPDSAVFQLSTGGAVMRSLGADDYTHMAAEGREVADVVPLWSLPCCTADAREASAPKRRARQAPGKLGGEPCGVRPHTHHH